MMYARMGDGTFILGLDEENVRRLKEGQPIYATLGKLGGQDDIIIMYGETLDGIRKELESYVGKPLPAAEELPGGH